MQSSYMTPLKFIRVVPAWKKMLPEPLDHYLFICTWIYVKARQEETLNFLL